MTYDNYTFGDMDSNSRVKKDSQRIPTLTPTDDADLDIDLDADLDIDAYISPYSILPTDEEREIIIQDALEEITEYMRDRALDYKREDFSSDIIEDTIYSYLCMHFSDITPYRSDFSKATSAEAEALNNVLELFLQELYEEILERFYEEVAPPRACNVSFIDGKKYDEPTITAKLDILRSKPQPEQRTAEWYLRRNNLITASSASKAFGSPSAINQLIYEKCKNHTANHDSGAGGAFDSPTTDFAFDECSSAEDKETHKVVITSDAILPPALQQQQHVSLNSPLHWGQRYEPVTVQLYESRNHTKLGEFGCIQHDTYSFIGASPDGINVDPTSQLYGRMVEIKNIVNRDITGIPKEEYWIQTQIQMEVCDINETDFVETRIKEYDDEESFLADSPIDSPNSRNYTENKQEKGIIIWFQPAPVKNPNGAGFIYSMPLYEYAPLGMTQEEYDKWEQDILVHHEKNACFWVRNIYWYVDQYSCVLILRNRLWFQAAVPVLQELWNTIEKERKTGFAHRAPKKKTKTASSSNADGPGGSSGDSTAEYVNVVKIDLSTTSSTTIKGNIHGGGGGGGGVSGGLKPIMRPSDVLIKCFKIDNLDMNDS